MPGAHEVVGNLLAYVRRDKVAPFLFLAPPCDLVEGVLLHPVAVDEVVEQVAEELQIAVVGGGADVGAGAQLLHRLFGIAVGEGLDRHLHLPASVQEAVEPFEIGVVTSERVGTDIFAFGFQEFLDALLHRGAAEVSIIFQKRVPSLIQFPVDFAAKCACIPVPVLSPADPVHLDTFTHEGTRLWIDDIKRYIRGFSGMVFRRPEV